MRQLCLALIMLFAQICKGQLPVSFQIEGNYAPAKTGFAYLLIPASSPQKSLLFQSAITTNHFSFSGFIEANPAGYTIGKIFFDSIANLRPADIYAKSKAGSKYVEVIPDKKAVLSINRDLSLVGVTESRINNEYLELQTIRSLLKNKSYAKIVDLQLQYFSALAGFVVKYPESQLARPEFIRLLSIPPQLKNKLRADFSDMFSAVDSTWLVHPTARSLITDINRIQRTTKFKKGDLIPDYVFNDEGDSVSISHYRGKYLLLYFWTSWSVPSARFQQQMEKAFLQYPSSAFTVLQVSLDHNISSWKKFFEGRTILWKQARLKRGWDEKVVSVFDIRSVPHNYLLDKSGILLGQDLSPAQITDLLKHLPG